MSPRAKTTRLKTTSVSVEEPSLVTLVPAPPGSQVYPAWWSWLNYAMDPEKEWNLGEAPDTYVCVTREDKDLLVGLLMRIDGDKTVRVTPNDWAADVYAVPRERWRRVRVGFDRSYMLLLHVMGSRRREVVDLRVVAIDGAYAIEVVCRQPSAYKPL